MSTSSMLLRDPQVHENLSADRMATGIPVPPIQRIRLFSSAEWEEFVEEWATTLKEKYTRIERCGGSGDMGRDVIGIVNDNTDVWDNFQCKHYGHPLQPGDIWIELGKLTYYTYRGFYTYPREYHFVAPQGAGPSLSRLLNNENALRTGLIDKWDTHCRTKITADQEVVLDADLRIYLDRKRSAKHHYSSGS